MLRCPVATPCFFRWFTLLLAGILLGGCGWANRPAGDPRKDPNYLDGMSWKDQGRYDLARDSFQRASDVNPSNRFALLELGMLHLQRFNRPVSAIYYFERYLELGRRQEGQTFTDEFVQNWIKSAKISLAVEYASEIGRERSELEMDQLRRRNADLEQKVELLSQQLGSMHSQLQAYAQAAAANANPQGNAAGGTPQVSQSVQQPAPQQPQQAQQNRQPPQQQPQQPQRPAAPPVRTHVIRSGENPSIVARQYGVPLAELMAANPNVDPNRMRPGDVLRIPSR